MNPYYLTPDYMAGYRPDYAGPEGFNRNDNSDPTMWQGARDLSPFGNGIPYYANVSSSIDPSISSIYQRPVDHSVSFTQRFVVPVASFAVANRLARAKVLTQNSMYRSMAQWGASFGGGSESTIAAAGMRQGIFTAMGDSLGRGTVNGIFGGARAFSRFGLLGDGALATGMRGAMADAAGIAGGVAGSVAIPLGLAYGMTKGAQTAFFDPYIASRRTDMALQRDFSRTYFGADGRPISGLGFSHLASARAASGITTSGINDYTFNEQDYGAIADFSARSGLLNDMGSAGQLKQRVKQIANEIKVVMSVANEPSVKEAVKMLANLKMAGAGSSVASSAINQIGQASNAAGVSVQRLMNTVGSQGQYLYQANHLVPYLGQIAGANAMSSFQSAFRNGLISPSLMAMMGGTEGATQSVVSAGVMGAQTPYAMMSAYNRYLGGGARSGVFGNIGAFASAMSNNPLGTVGAMGLNAPILMSKQLRDQGSSGVLSQAMDIANTMSYLTKDGKGKYQANALYQIMTSTMGLSPEQARAILIKSRSDSDPTNMAYLAGANKSFRAQQEEAIINQTGNWNPLWMGAKNIGHHVVSGTFNTLIAPVEESIGSLKDMSSKAYQRVMYGMKDPTQLSDSVDAFLHGGKGNTHVAYIPPKSLSGYGRAGKGALGWLFSDVSTGTALSIRSFEDKVNKALTGKIKVSPAILTQLHKLVQAGSPSQISSILATIAYLPGSEVLGDVHSLSKDHSVALGLSRTNIGSVSDQSGTVATLAGLSGTSMKVVNAATGVNDANTILNSRSMGQLESTSAGSDAVSHIAAVSGKTRLSYSELRAQAQSIHDNYSKTPTSSRGRIALAATDAALQITEHLTDGSLSTFLGTEDGKRAKKLLAIATGRSEAELGNLNTLVSVAKSIYSGSEKQRILGLGATTRGISVKDLLTGGASVNKRIAENAVRLGKGGLTGNFSTHYSLGDSDAILSRDAQNVESSITRANDINKNGQQGGAIDYSGVLQGLNDSSSKMAAAALTFQAAVGVFARSVSNNTMRPK